MHSTKFSHALHQVHELVAQTNTLPCALYSFSLDGSQEDCMPLTFNSGQHPSFTTLCFQPGAPFCPSHPVSSRQSCILIGYKTLLQGAWGLAEMRVWVSCCSAGGFNGNCYSSSFLSFIFPFRIEKCILQHLRVSLFPAVRLSVAV